MSPYQDRPQRLIPIGVRGEYVEVGAHVAYFWESDREFRDGVSFLTEGLAAGDFCVIFGHEDANQRVCAVLGDQGLDCGQLSRDNRICVLSGDKDAGAMLGSIGEAFTRAIDGGATLIRLLGNIGWGRESWPSERDIMEFEAKVTGAAKAFPCVVVCMYDVQSLSGKVIVHGAFETHPLTICGNMLRENPHYVPVEDFLKRLDTVAEGAA
jgi:hypothetical protein